MCKGEGDGARKIGGGLTGRVIFGESDIKGKGEQGSQNEGKKAQEKH